jgi:hypothetical protein
MSPLMTEWESNNESQEFCAESHVKHLKMMLYKKYCKSVEMNVTHFNLDHASVNVLMCKILNKPMIGCRSHRHSLQMQYLVKTY